MRPTSGMIDPSTLSSLTRQLPADNIIIRAPASGCIHLFEPAGGRGFFSRSLHIITQLSAIAWCSMYGLPPGLSPRIRGQCESPLLIIPSPCPHVTQLFFAPVMVCNAPCTVQCTVLGSVLPPLLHCLAAATLSLQTSPDQNTAGSQNLS